MDRVDGHETGIVPVAGIFDARISQACDEERRHGAVSEV
jgi:hypothetical protein